MVENESAVTSTCLEFDAIESLLEETIVPIGTLARELDHDIGTVTRWCMRGTRATAVGGVRALVKLQHVRIGGKLYTSREAFRRYVAAMTSPGPVTPMTITSTAGRTPAQRRRASEAAEREARRLGC